MDFPWALNDWICNARVCAHRQVMAPTAAADVAHYYLVANLCRPRQRTPQTDSVCSNVRGIFPEKDERTFLRSLRHTKPHRGCSLWEAMSKGFSGHKNSDGGVSSAQPRWLQSKPVSDLSLLHPFPLHIPASSYVRLSVGSRRVTEPWMWRGNSPQFHGPIILKFFRQ